MWDFFCNFAPDFDIHIVYDGFREGGIKRESGVNPGQSRCCEFLYSVQQQVTAARWEDVETGNKSEDLPHTMLGRKSSRKDD